MASFFSNDRGTTPENLPMKKQHRQCKTRTKVCSKISEFMCYIAKVINQKLFLKVWLTRSGAHPVLHWISCMRLEHDRSRTLLVVCNKLFIKVRSILKHKEPMCQTFELLSLNFLTNFFLNYEVSKGDLLVDSISAVFSPFRFAFTNRKISWRTHKENLFVFVNSHTNFIRLCLKLNKKSINVEIWFNVKAMAQICCQE